MVFDMFSSGVWHLILCVSQNKRPFFLFLDTPYCACYLGCTQHMQNKWPEAYIFLFWKLCSTFLALTIAHVLILIFVLHAIEVFLVSC